MQTTYLIQGTPAGVRLRRAAEGESYPLAPVKWQRVLVVDEHGDLIHPDVPAPDTQTLVAQLFDRRLTEAECQAIRDQETLDGTAALIQDDAGYVRIKFQRGPIAEVGVNGTTMEAILQVLIDRLAGFQAGPFANDFNARALLHLRSALAELQSRTADRLARGVEGRNVR